MAVADLFEQPVNETDAVGFFLSYPNDVTGGVFALGILLVIYVIVFGSLLRFGIDRAFAAASFIGLLVAITFTAMGVVGGEVFTVSVVVVILAILFAGSDKR